MDRAFSLSRCCSYMLSKYTYTYTYTHILKKLCFSIHMHIHVHIHIHIHIPNSLQVFVDELNSHLDTFHFCTLRALHVTILYVAMNLFFSRLALRRLGTIQVSTYRIENVLSLSLSLSLPFSRLLLPLSALTLLWIEYSLFHDVAAICC